MAKSVNPNAGHSREWWKAEIDRLNKKNCKTGKELQDTLDSLLEAHAQYAKAEIVEFIVSEFSSLVIATPKELGRAQAGWQITPMKTEWKPPVLEKKAKRDSEGNIVKNKKGKTIYEQGVLPEFADLIAKNMPDEVSKLRLSEADVIYITNNVEYILALEAGWSVQAPNGFIALFLQRVKTGLARMAAKL